MGTKYKAKFLGADGSEREIEVEAKLKPLQELVGGYIEMVRIRDGMMIVDEEGLVKNKPQNEKASQLYAGGYIAGDAIVFTGDEWRRFDEAFA